MKRLAFVVRSATTIGLVGLAALMLTVPRAGAQIYESIDAAGTRHFTNLICSLPEAARAGARVFVEAGPMSKVDDSAPGSTEQPTSARTAQQAVERDAAVTDTFNAGWSRGFKFGRGAFSTPPQPPIVIAPSPPPVVVVAPPGDPSGLYYQSPYAGAVTTPFDGGRSRGLTRRQQMEDRIQEAYEWR